MTKFQEFVEDPANFAHFLDHISAGGSGPQFCRAYKITFHALVRWINADDQRQKQYAVALRARKEWVVEEILAQARSIAMLNPKALYSDAGGLKHPSEWPDELAACVDSLEQVDYFEGSGEDREQVGHLKKIKFHSKLKAIELLGKNLALFNETTKHEIGESLGDLIGRALQKPPPPGGTLLTGEQAVMLATTKQQKGQDNGEA